MKWWTIFCVTLAGLIFANTLLATENDTSEPVNVKSISYIIDEQEVVNFQLSAAVAPKVFSMDGGNPRIVIDLPGALYDGPRVKIPPEAALVAKLRIGLHEEPALKTRVVLDLNKEKIVDYKVENDGETVKIVLSGTDKVVSPASDVAASVAAVAAPEPEIAADKPAEPPQPEPAKPVVEKKLVETATIVPPPAKKPAKESKEELTAKPLDQKPVPPVFAVKNDQAKVKKEKQQPAVTKKAELEKISFDDSSEKGEMVLFQLNDFYPPTVTAIETDNPGVVCEFTAMGVADSVKKTIYANGRFVERIRTESQDSTGSVKVFLDLAPNYDYDLQQVFFKTDNLFVLIVNELSEKKEASSAN